MKPRRYGAFGVVPWVTLWSAEAVPWTVLRNTQARRPETGRLCLPAEHSRDCDEYGVLWKHNADAQGNGTPHLAHLHCDRQRQAMRRPRCQVCGTLLPAKNIPWLFPTEEWDTLPDQSRITGTPPTCRDCWKMATTLCPHLHKGAVGTTVRRHELWGISGRYYPPDTDTFGSHQRAIPYRDHHELPHILAMIQLVTIGQARPIQQFRTSQ